MGSGATGKTGGLFKLLFVLVIVVLAIGLWRSWFSFSMKSDQTASSNKTNKTTKVTMTIDRNRLQEDAAAVAEAAKKGVQELQKKAQGLQNGTTTVTGVVTGISNDDQRITVENGDQITLQVTDETTITKGDETLNFGAIKVKDRARITYRKSGSTNRVDSISIQPPLKKEPVEKESKPEQKKTPDEKAPSSGESAQPGQSAGEEPSS